MRVSDILGVWKLFMTRLFIPGYIPPLVWNYRPCPRTQLIVGMILGNCLAPNWRPAIIWTNADPFPGSSTLAHICGTRGKWVNSPTLQNQCALSQLLRNHWSLRERWLSASGGRGAIPSCHTTGSSWIFAVYICFIIRSMAILLCHLGCLVSKIQNGISKSVKHIMPGAIWHSLLSLSRWLFI